MNTITSQIEQQLITQCTTMLAMNQEVIDLSQYYFASPASGLINALPTADSPATTQNNGALSQSNFQGGITLVQALLAFFGNSSVSTSNYKTYANALINGSFPIVTPLSADVENIGGRLRTLGANFIQLGKDSANTIYAYNNSSLSSVIGSIPSSTVVFGCNTVQSKFVSGIVLLEQFQNFMTGSAVTTGNYISTIGNFVLGS